MNTEKLYQKLEQVEIKQTIAPIRFKDEAINKIKKQNIEFRKRSFIFIPFIVSKDSHQKGLKLRILKGHPGDKHTVKVFYLVYWFNGKSIRHMIGNYSQSFGVKECDEYLINFLLSA